MISKSKLIQKQPQEHITLPVSSLGIEQILHKIREFVFVRLNQSKYVESCCQPLVDFPLTLFGQVHQAANGCEEQSEFRASHSAS